MSTAARIVVPARTRVALKSMMSRTSTDQLRLRASTRILDSDIGEGFDNSAIDGFRAGPFGQGSESKFTMGLV
jgi:hypothetical protein